MDSLAEMARRSKDLSRLDDELRARIAEIEEQLAARISVRIETPIDEEHDLLFCRIEKRWGLVVLTDHGETALAYCSREMRSLVFEKQLIEQLLRDGLAQINDMIVERQNALGKANEILEALKGAT